MNKMFREVFFDGKNRLVSVEDLLKENKILQEKLDIAVKTLMKYEMYSGFEGGMGSDYEDMMWDCTGALKQIEEVK